MTDLVEWPASVGPASFDMHPTGAARQTVGLDNRPQVVTVENRVWRGTISLPAMDAATSGAWLAFLAELNGPGAAFDVPVGDPLAIDPLDGGAQFLLSAGYTQAQIDAGQVAFSGGEVFSGGEGFALASYANPTVYRDTPAGASVLYVSGLLAGMMRPGQVFSVGAFLHRVTRVRDGRLNFAPPLRADLSAGDVVEVIAPVIRARLVEDAGGQSPWQVAGIVPGVSVGLVEVFAR